MNPRRIQTKLLAIAITATLAALASSHAAIYNEPFNSPLNGLPTGWQVIWAGTATTGPANGTARIENFGDSQTGLRQTRNNNAPGNSIVRYTGSEGLFDNGIIADFEMNILFTPFSNDNNYSFGVVARAGSLSDINTFNGYYFAVQGQNNTVRIYRDVVANNDLGTQLASGSFTAVGGVTYRMNITAFGSQLSMSIYGWSTETESYSNLLQSVSATDATYASGNFGLRNGMQGSTRGVYWQNLSVIPEPSAVALLVLAGGAMLLRLRRKRAA